MWTKYRVRWEFLNNLAAGIPANPDLQKKWIESRKPKNKPPEGKSIDQIAKEVMETTIPQQEFALHVFQRYSGQLVVRMSTVRAHIKDIVTVLSSLYVGKIQGERSFAVRAKNALYYDPDIYWLPIVDARGKPVVEPSGTVDKPIHAMTPRGPISAIKTMEMIEKPVLEFPLWVLTAPSGRMVISEGDLKTIFTYGGVHGYGPERGDGEGKYTFKMTLIEKPEKIEDSTIEEPEIVIPAVTTPEPETKRAAKPKTSKR